MDEVLKTIGRSIVRDTFPISRTVKVSIWVDEETFDKGGFSQAPAFYFHFDKRSNLLEDISTKKESAPALVPRGPYGVILKMVFKRQMNFPFNSGILQIELEAY